MGIALTGKARLATFFIAIVILGAGQLLSGERLDEGQGRVLGQGGRPHGTGDQRQPGSQQRLENRPHGEG